MKKAFFLFFSFSYFFSWSQTDAQLESGRKKQNAGNHSQAIQDFTAVINAKEAEVKTYLATLDEYNKVPASERKEKEMEKPKTDVLLAIPYLLRGKSLSTLGKNADALNDLNTAIKIDNKLAEAYYQRGRLQWITGKKTDGCIDLGRAASLKDKDAKDMYEEKFCWKDAVAAANSANFKLKSKEYQAAIDAIQPAIKLCPDSARYFGIRGRALQGLGNNEEAMKDFDKAISIAGTSFDAWFGRGSAHLAMGKWQQAFDDLTQAININDKAVDAYLMRGQACEELGIFQSALFDYQQVQRLLNSGIGWYRAGLVRQKMNDEEGACKDFQKASDMSYADAFDLAEKCPKKRRK